jgi:hypothetical protein
MVTVTLTKDEVYKRLATAAFGSPLVSNMYRGLVAEVIVHSALSSNWKWCSADWAGWDFVHNDGTKLEVKQSASLQTWSKDRVTKCTFGIAPTSGYWEGDVWTPNPGRQSSIYVFAHHPGTDLASTDHRDPQQWRFYVLPSDALPPATRSIGLQQVRLRSASVWREIDKHQKSPCEVHYLADAIETLRIKTKSQSAREGQLSRE